MRNSQDPHAVEHHRNGSSLEGPEGARPVEQHGGEPTISVCIVCRDEADKLRPCLESVQWADEIIMMDLQSTDSSAELAREYGARVVTREPHPIVEPLRNELAAIAAGEWILALDPDERISPALAQELRRLARRADLDAIVIPRTNWDLGYQPSHAIQRYEPQLRMYRRATVVWPEIPNKLPVIADDHKYRIPNRDELVITHDRSRNIAEVLDRVVRYAPAQAQSMRDQGQEFTAFGMLSALVAQIDKEFFQAKAWHDGVPGILRASILVAYKFYVWAAFWQISGARRTRADDRLLRRIGLVLDTLRAMVRLGAGAYRLARALVERLPVRRI